MRYFFLMITVLVASITFVSCEARPKGGVCTIVLANPRSGQQAAIGREISRALQLVQDELATTSIASIQIKEVDTQSSPAVARAEVGRAVAQWHSPIIVGSILSSETREFLQPMLSQNVVVLANGSSDPAIRTLPFRKSGDGFFRNWPADDFEGIVMAEYLRSTKRASKLVVLHANDPYASSLAKAFVRRFNQLGGVILGPETYPADMTRFEELVRRQQMGNHDGYYVVGFPTDLAGIYNTLRRLDVTKDMPVYSAVGINTGEFVDLAKYPLDKLFFTAPAVDDSSGPYFKFRESYRKKFGGESPDIVAAVSYDALEIAVSAVKSVGCDSGRIRKSLYESQPFDGASGLTGFDSFGDVVTKGVAINYYEGGRRLQAEVRSATKE